MQFDLSSQVILVTGASRGIGKAIAEVLAQTKAKLALQYVKSEKAAQDLKEKLSEFTEVKIFQADLSQFNACESLILEVIESFGKLDGLVNNAGIALNSPLETPIENWTQDWDFTMAVNLRAVGILSRLAIEQFKKQSTGGRLVHISSRAAYRGDTEDYLAYATSKAGVLALSHSIARAFGKDNIKSFVIAPGFTKTAMAEDFIKKYGEEYATNDIALPKLTEPKDIAPMIMMLLSGMADHATGTSIDFNAGSYLH